MYCLVCRGFLGTSTPSVPKCVLVTNPLSVLFQVTDGGVPMEVVLTPISWFANDAARLQNTISEDTIQKAVKIYEEFETSSQYINDLLTISEDCFLSWRWRCWRPGVCAGRGLIWRRRCCCWVAAYWRAVPVRG